MENQEEILKRLKRIENKTKATYGWVLFLGILTILGAALGVLSILLTATKL